MADIDGKYYLSNYMAHQQRVVGSFSEIHQHSYGGVSPRCRLASLRDLDNNNIFGGHVRIIGYDITVTVALILQKLNN